MVGHFTVPDQLQQTVDLRHTAPRGRRHHGQRLGCRVIACGVQIDLEAVAGGEHEDALDVGAARYLRAQVVSAVEDPDVTEIQLVMGGTQQLKGHDRPGSLSGLWGAIIVQ